MSLDDIAAALTRPDVPSTSGSLLNGCSPLLPERWQGERPSLGLRRDVRALIAAWGEGESRVPHGHGVKAQRHAAADAGRLMHDLEHTYNGVRDIPELEWRRILDCCFICGLMGWSNVHMNTTGDGARKPLIEKGKRYKMASDGRIIY